MGAEIDRKGDKLKLFKIENNRLSFYQWDLNQRLIVEDDSITEVHFCNKTGDCSLVCEVYEEDDKRLVDVPNILLQDNWTIRVYAYCKNYTKIEKKINVLPRSKPADYVYTETELKRYEDLEERLAALEEKEVDVDLTGYATEDFVTAALNENAPNWNADGASLDDIKGVIANRTHYTKQIFKAKVDGELAEGTVKLLDLSGRGYKSYLQYLTPKYQKEKYCFYPVTIKYDLVSGNNRIPLGLTNGKAIDNTNNYTYTTIGGFTLYVILDREDLNDELKARFNTNGIYTYTANSRSASTSWVANLRYELRTVEKKLDYSFMPTQFLEAAEATELYYTKTEVEEKLAVLADRIAALEE